MSLSRVLRGSGANAFGQIGIAVVQIVTVPALANIWGLAVYGTWIVLSTIPAYLVFADLGLATAAGSEMAMAVGREERDRVLVTYQSAIMAVCCISLTLIVVAGLLCLLLPDVVFPAPGAYTPNVIRVTVFLLSTYGVLSFISSLLLAGYRSGGFYAAGTMYVATLQIVEGLAVVATAMRGGGLLHAAVALLILRTVAIGLLALRLRVMMECLRIGIRHGSYAEIRRIAGPSLGALALSGGQMSLLLGTVLTLGVATSTSAVAVFTATRTLTRTAIQLCGIATRAIMPEYAFAVGRRDVAASDRLLLAALASSIVVIGPAAIALPIFGTSLIQLWTRGAIEARPGLIILMTIAMVPEAVWWPLSNLLLAANRHGAFALSSMVLSTLGVILSYPAARLAGAEGTAMVLALLSGLMLLLTWKQITRYHSPARLLAIGNY